MNIFTPVPLNKRELVRPVDVFTPTPRNWKELERPGDVFSPASRNTRSGIAIKEIAEREPATRLDRSFLLGERNESN